MRRVTLFVDASKSNRRGCKLDGDILMNIVLNDSTNMTDWEDNKTSIAINFRLSDCCLNRTNEIGEKSKKGGQKEKPEKDD